MPNDDHWTHFKLIITGDGGVGKTSLYHTYERGEWILPLLTTGVEFLVKKTQVDKSVPVKLQIWDFGGEERFRYLLPTYVKGADGILFCYDTTFPLTLSHFEDWLPILRQEDPDIPIMLAGTKTDLKHLRRVKLHEGIGYAKSHNCAGYVEISSKAMVNVNEVFEAMLKMMWDDKPRKDALRKKIREDKN